MPSKAYEKAIQQCQQFHRTRKTFSGNGVLKHSQALLEFSNGIGAGSGIDYGCGKGLQYTKLIGDPAAGWTLEEALGFEVYKYDPGVLHFEEPPTDPADLVWCVDVLECVPEQDMPHMVEELARLAIKGLFVTVASYPSKKTLPNGMNAHLTIKPEAWWREQFAPLAVERPDLKLVLLVA